MTVRQALQRSAAFLAERDVDSPRLSAELLLARVLGLSRLDLFLDMDRPLSGPEQEAFGQLCRRRGQGEPVAYILGFKEFFGLDFALGPAALIPRPETELIVELARERFPSDRALAFADLGAGCGALAVVLARTWPRSSGLAIDLSLAALDLARINAEAHGVSGRLALVRADFTRPVLAAGSLDLAVCNPPYLSEAEFRQVSREVSGFEPKSALVAGPRGDELLGPAARVMAEALRPGGAAMMEIGWTQAGSARLAFEGLPGIVSVEVRKDLARLDRVVVASKACPGPGKGIENCGEKATELKK
ncbi:MAG: peptide chain release factor N(5)-glutamine methyltransferase [Desulfovibrionaceae bacterium]|nr:peptide chain release factor N(5)-glutamine methyltransferase [Desulfovibrionaceae bacterium]MDD4951101.1 peptide chain release factor N(5)-glutamine methyltransferase [Desulfovibrionaceae bacterium]